MAKHRTHSIEFKRQVGQASMIHEYADCVYDVNELRV